MWNLSRKSRKVRAEGIGTHTISSDEGRAEQKLVWQLLQSRRELLNRIQTAELGTSIGLRGAWGPVAIASSELLRWNPITTG